VPELRRHRIKRRRHVGDHDAVELEPADGGHRRNDHTRLEAEITVEDERRIEPARQLVVEALRMLGIAR